MKPKLKRTPQQTGRPAAQSQKLKSKRRPLPQGNDAILRAFDDLIKSQCRNHFVPDAPDQEHPELRWDILGDRGRNWLYVMVSNPKRNLRYAAVTDHPGSWSIASQRFGMDVETQTIAGELADQLFQSHKTELLG